MKSKKARAELVQSMAGIVSSVVESLTKVDAKLDTELARKHSAAEAYKMLVDKERMYFKLAKQFQEVCCCCCCCCCCWFWFWVWLMDVSIGLCVE
jgi:hypothetical protein